MALKREKLVLLEQRERLREGLPHLYGWKWYGWAKEFFDSTNKLNLLCAGNQSSKPLKRSTQIPTPRGLRCLGDLRVGDEVFAGDGSVTLITAIPYEGEEEGYCVTFTDGTNVICGLQHEWVCKPPAARFNKYIRHNWPRSPKRGQRTLNRGYGKWVVMTTEEIIAAGRYAPHATYPSRRVSIPLAKPLQLPEWPLFDPYFLGLLLGDGHFGSTIRLYATERAIIEYAVRRHGARKLKGGRVYSFPGLAKQIRSLGLSGKRAWNKRIPPAYFLGSVPQRLALLRGLMDTDGTASKTRSKHVSLTTVSPGLAGDVRELVCSLGGTARIRRVPTKYKDATGEYVHCHDAYVVAIKMRMNPFRLKRKARRFRLVTRKYERVIECIEPVGKVKMRCITVAHHSGTFLCTRGHVVTHNSSTQIRKCIDWATDKVKWPILWRHQPNHFWYLYPTSKQARIEFETKWKLFLPKGEYKTHPIYGWKEEWLNKELFAIHFNSGVHVYFKTYAQDVQSLQTGTCDALFLDEELPVDLYDELIFRISASDGYFHMVFTATLGQEMWRLVMEPRDGEEEKLPHAAKWTVSLYDCLQYIDGSPTHWTREKIRMISERCATQKEVLKRVYGRFIKDDGGLKCEQFDVKRHIVPPASISEDWQVYGAVDIGSGGKKNHKAAIIFLAVNSDYSKGIVFDGWRGDGLETTAGDILEKFKAMRGARTLARQVYDWGSKDFGLIAGRCGEAFTPADKSHERGEALLNALFKNDLITIHDTPELRKLVGELISLRRETAKERAKDDFYDALRYCVTSIPWDWSLLGPQVTASEIVVPKSALQQQIDDRRGGFSEYAHEHERETVRVEDEFEEANEAYGD